MGCDEEGDTTPPVGVTARRCGLCPTGESERGWGIKEGYHHLHHQDWNTFPEILMPGHVSELWQVQGAPDEDKVGFTSEILMLVTVSSYYHANIRLTCSAYVCFLNHNQ